MQDIHDEVAEAYRSVYNENSINQLAMRQTMNDETIRIFSERYGLEHKIA